MSKQYTIEQAEEEVRAVLEAMPQDSVVRVHEGGGPEDVFASLAVSVMNLSGAVSPGRPKGYAGREAVRWAAAYGRALERHGLHVATIKRCHELADRAYEELFCTSSGPAGDTSMKESHSEDSP